MKNLFHSKRIEPTLLIFLFMAIASGAEERPALINIKEIAPRIQVDMRYASPNNFTKTILYPAAECLLCEPAAQRLARVQKKLELKGLGLKVWDCYRPVSVQKKLWSIVPDDRYVANPARGSKHNRGASVDLTLVDKTGKELAMPTPFDEFSERAHRGFNNLSEEAIRNRSTLQEAMESEGFIPLATEWWHFDDPAWMNYALRDEPLGSSSLRTDREGKTLPALLPGQCQQLVLVLSHGWSMSEGTAVRFEKGSKEWKKIGSEWPVNLGSHGMAWGRGLHTLDLNGPLKKETDKTTPAGIFKIGQAYGPALKPPEHVMWPYQHIDEKWVCVDDSSSASYNQVRTVPPSDKKDWSSAETMLRSDQLYKWVINIEQNFPDTKLDCGSCIFFHVWRKPGSPTDGCVAMTEEHLLGLLGWLNPAAEPCVVILPEDIYAKLKNLWKLP